MPEGWRSRAGRLATEREPTREDEGSEFSCREWASHYQSKRDDALRSASQNWKARGMAGRGEVAFYYAQRVGLPLFTRFMCGNWWNSLLGSRV